MKKIILTLLASTFCLSAQNQDAGKKELPQWVVDLKALSDDDQKEYSKISQRCKQLFDQKRIFECLAAIWEAEDIYTGNPGLLNLRGACYVEFRNFDKALKAFDVALEIQKSDFNVRFNIAEIKFVSQKYQEALTDLEALYKEAVEDPNYANMVSLIQFKTVLCKLKLKAPEGAKAIIDETDFLSDSPLYYYGNAALEYSMDKGAEAEKWLARARRIFQNPQILAPWQDTLIEFGYIKSFYGGDLEIESAPEGE
ncbi:hypothetical protein N9A94_09450 [Akkermansiaceae bacterium]|nr:hypothetical protein [Akkermansiaceae bacterium]MDA7888784.1 hypothetical protein [Akkermansiaceae bacterium]